jgi:hypothetical protein
VLDIHFINSLVFHPGGQNPFVVAILIVLYLLLRSTGTIFRAAGSRLRSAIKNSLEKVFQLVHYNRLQGNMRVFWIRNTLTVTRKMFGLDLTSLTKVKTICGVWRVSPFSHFGSVRQQALKLICIKLRR